MKVSVYVVGCAGESHVIVVGWFGDGAVVGGVAVGAVSVLVWLHIFVGGWVVAGGVVVVNPAAA